MGLVALWTVREKYKGDIDVMNEEFGPYIPPKI